MSNNGRRTFGGKMGYREGWKGKPMPPGQKPVPPPGPTAIVPRPVPLPEAGKPEQK